MKTQLKKLIREMEENGEMEKINRDLETFEKNKFEIFKECIQKAHHMLIFEKHNEFVEYCDKIGVYPTDEELEKYM